MKFEIKGLDEFERNLNNLQKKARELDGEHDVPFDELFPPDFMRTYTDFPNITEMIKESGFQVKSTEDFKKIPDAEWDAYVAKRTRFPNWKEMQATAAKLYIKKKLGL